MKLSCHSTPEEVAGAAAEFVAARTREALAARGRFSMALSGGSTPWLMLHRLADYELPWTQVHVVQVDERAAPDGHRERNLTHIREQFVDRIGGAGPHLHPMPVECADLGQGAGEYGTALRRIAGVPPVLDLVHLGLGSDGHTASLVPGDPVLRETEVDVGVTRPYQGRVRMTLTFPVINRARDILWLICGAGKAAMLERLIRGDTSIPAGRVRGPQATIVTDIPLPPPARPEEKDDNTC